MFSVKKKDATVQKFGLGNMFGNDFESSLLSSPSLHLFDEKYSKKKSNMKYLHFTSFIILNIF